MTFKYSVKPYFKTPKRMGKKPTLSIRQIARGVSQNTRLKSRDVGIEEAYEGKSAAALPGYTHYKFTTQNTKNGHRYRISVYSPTKKVDLDTKVIIDDPNPLAVYRYEYALAKRGNAFIYRTNGDPPEQTNPKLKPGLSHHGYRVLQYLVKHTTKKGLGLSREK